MSFFKVEEISKMLGIKKDDIINIYVHGSTIYDKLTETSDLDLSVVYKKSNYKFEDQKKFDGIDFNLYEEEHFLKLLGECDEAVIELVNY